MNGLLRTLTDPWNLSFFARGVVASVLVMLAGAALGYGVVHRRQAYFGQGVGQSMILGVSVGSLWGIAPGPAAFAAALLAAALIHLLARSSRISADTAIAVVSTVALSAGIAVISANRERSVNVGNVLLGNVLGVTGVEILVLGGAGVLAWGYALAAGRRDALRVLSPAVARAHDAGRTPNEPARIVLLAAVTAASVQVVGVTLLVVALVFPVATAGLMARTLKGIHVLAALLAALTGIGGMYLSYWADLASGPALVLVAGGTYFATAALQSARRR